MTSVIPDFVRGDATGLMIPAHRDALIAAGPEFLTTAFRAFGQLPRDNAVVRIARAEPFLPGSTGKKLLLTLDYAYPGPESALFVKFSRDFDDVFRDRRRFELEPEIRFAELSRRVQLPVAVPSAIFADFDHRTGTGLFITPVIPFGNGVIEPLKHKYMDHELADPVAYYRAILAALASLAAAHQTGALDPHVDELFPYDPVAAAAEDKIPWSADDLRRLIADYARFADQCPALLPEPIRSPAFIARLEHEALRVLAEEAAIKAVLQGNRTMIALSHFNAQIDNAWFWHEPDGLRCGLLDWQRARQMNLAYALWGALSGMSPGLFEQELDGLLDYFVGQLARHGGPRLDRVELQHHFLLYMATMGLAGLMEAPRLVLGRLPQAVTASGPFDPMFEQSEGARSFLHILTNFFTLWRSRDIGGSIDFALSAARRAGA